MPENVDTSPKSNGDANTLLKVQRRKIADVKRILSNYGKDGKAKKTTTRYFTYRIETLKSEITILEANHKLLQELSSEEVDEYFDSGIYIDTVEDIQVWLSELEQGKTEISEPQKEKNTTSNKNEVDSMIESKLPRIALKSFSGCYSEWPSFKGLFLSIVDSNKAISNIQKMNYLKCHLEGDAEELLRNFAISAENYQPAFETLTKRYENKRVLVHQELNRIFEMKSCTDESSVSLRKLIDTFNGVLKALNNLEVDTSKWDVLINHIILTKLPTSIKQAWNQETGGLTELPSYLHLVEFLENRFRAWEMSNTDIKIRKHQVFATTTLQCMICKGSHKLYQCEKFKTFDVKMRNKIVQSNKLCFNCLNAGHNSNKCKSIYKCRVCEKRHHSLLHSPTNNNNKPTPNELNANATEFNGSTGTSLTVMTSTTRKQVLLATAIINVFDKNGHIHNLRALVDGGSQATFISENAAQLLRLKRKPYNADVIGIGGCKAGSTKGSVLLKIKLIRGQDLMTDALIIPSLSKILPQHKVIKKKWKHLDNLLLADHNFDTPRQIDILLGADVYAAIIEGEIVSGPPETPIAQSTKLGWIVFGQIQQVETEESFNSFTTTLDDINDQVKLFWKLDEIPLQQIESEEDVLCEIHFNQTHSRRGDGRYVVRLPFKDQMQDKLGYSKHSAISTLLHLENRFDKQPKLKSAYVDVMNEYQDLNHMKVSSSINPLNVFLPHHGISKNDRETTKLRVVYDASRKTSSGISLNDTLMTGPTLQADMITTLCKWRLYQYASTADIRQMYRQVDVHEDDTKFQSIVWRSEKSEPIRNFQLTTVTFGLTCAPFLAIRAMQQLADDEGAEFPLGAQMIRTEFYVDDLMSCSPTLTEAKEKQHQIQHILKRGGFHLHKWISNEISLMEIENTFNANIQEIPIMSEEDSVKSLGLSWFPKQDTMVIRQSERCPVRTKRELLSQIARIFDPLGWIAPLVAEAKVLLKRVWLSRLEWDDALPLKFIRNWNTISSRLSDIHNIKIPRWIQFNPAAIMELHCFSDASKNAYGAAIYSRIIQNGKVVNVNLIMAKSKVSPKKEITIPKLELCGAVIATKLMIKCQDIFRSQLNTAYLWSDSTVVLAWIEGDPIRWKQFVANRVNYIHEMVPNLTWLHVPGKENPADLLTRFKSRSNLANNDLWWSGPAWLKHSREHWPSQPKIKETELELKRQVFTATLTEPNEILLRFSSFTQLIRITAYCLRFIQGCRNQNTQRGFLKTIEISNARTLWIKLTQTHHFAEEIQSLKNKRPIKKGNIIRLNPTLDKEDILRVNGRLSNANLAYDQTNPIILPSPNHFSDLILREIHSKTLHGGPQIMISTARKTFWIVQCRKAAKRTIRECVTCTRFKATTGVQLMGQLPTPRVNFTRTFAHTGVDYCGPIMVKTSKTRNAGFTKGYIALFICLAVKAIHLELVSDMRMETFLAALRRFTARRGMCSDIYSDCGSNFMAADKELRMIKQHESKTAEIIATENINWHFNPPSAPHFGGLWEAGVKSAKYHLKRIIGNQHLTFEELNTTLTQIESILNSRPLAPLTEEASELNALTPGHFIIGEALNSPPQRNLLNLNESYLSRWQRVQKMVQHFWKRWSSEYLTRLQHRPKWHKTQPNITPGKIVVIKDDNLPPNKWLMARILEVHPGADGLVRVVTLKTAHTILKRPITKIVVLPTEN